MFRCIYVITSYNAYFFNLFLAGKQNVCFVAEALLCIMYRHEFDSLGGISDICSQWLQVSEADEVPISSHV